MVRLLPFLLMAIAALIVLKTLSFVLFDAQSILGTGSALAQQAEAPAEEQAASADQNAAGSNEQAAEAGSEAAINGEQTADAAAQDQLPSEQPIQGRLIDPNKGGSSTQASIEERLSERRAELSKRERDLALREKLLKASEKRLDAKLKELRELNASGKGGKAKEEEEKDLGLKKLVTMYESMKPKEAARIFNALDLDVLYDVANAMSPRKMSAVLAAMELKVASALTVRLADRAIKAKDSMTRENLPKIGG